MRRSGTCPGDRVGLTPRLRGRDGSGQNRRVSQEVPRHRANRFEPREIVELRALKSLHPELASAVEMQIELVELQRRIQSRMSTPLVQRDDASIRRRLLQGERLVEFDDLRLDWTDFRLLFRQVADILRRYDALEPGDYVWLQVLARDGDRLRAVTVDYYCRTSRPDQAGPAPDDRPGMLEQVLTLALRPFLARSADVWMTKLDLSEWRRSWCLVCGGEPDFAVLPSSGDRWLICSRCSAQWPFTAACPFCGDDSLGSVTSFASRDGRYRVYGCNECRKYLKAYDARGASRPVMPVVDTIATLPLDAAAIQRGYDG